ncbi:MAG: hypothetical protein ABIR11_09605 [Candidatus Limnocylindrales bacterium]
MTTPVRRSGGLAALVIALLVAACGSPTLTPSPAATPGASPSASAAPSASGGASMQPSPSAAAAACDPNAPVESAPVPSSDANDPNAAVYTGVEGQVSALRGITATKPVARGVFDKAALCAYITASFREDNPAALVTATEDLYRALLLIPADVSLEDLYIELLTSQVAGLYNDKTKTMFVVSTTGEIGPVEKITYAHEYTHALQDQKFGLRAYVGDAKDQGDRTIARTAVVEGDATLLMSLWAQQHLTPQELGEVAATSDPAAQAVLDRMPAILKDSLLFPYTSGLQLALGAYQRAGGYAGVDALFADGPGTTEQILHPEKLVAHEAAKVVAFPASFPASLGDGWKVSLQDTLGEFQLEILLRDAAGSKASNDAAAGWGGDRVALVEGPGGANAVVLDTAWDSDADATEFAGALADYVARLKAAGRSAGILVPAPDRVVVISASDADTLGRVANVLGLAG